MDRRVRRKLRGALAVAAIVLVLATLAVAERAAAQPAPDSLKTIAVPRPDLSGFVRDEAAAVALGKAFFWDMQAGSDGVQACASCHFHAGADNRVKNQLNPGTLHGAGAFDFGGPNAALGASDFPFHELLNPDDRGSAVLFDSDDVMSSQGVFRADFVDVVPGQAEDACTSVADPIWHVGPTNVRQVEPRNTPTVINSAFNFRSFWDGRGNAIFNGVNIFGATDPNAHVLQVQPDGSVVPVTVAITPGHLASQAVGPPLSGAEMSCAGRTLPKVGKKLLSLTPLAKQLVDPADGVLGALAASTATPGQPGLTTSYAALIQQAFDPKWWSSPKIVTFAGGVATVSDPTGQPLTTEQFTVMEANFALFWGLAIQVFESTLISDDAPYDRFQEGDAAALTVEQKEGLRIFLNEGRCITHHLTPTFTGATTPLLGGEDSIQNMIMASGRADYDGSFYNIGVRPTAEDPGVGGTSGVNVPLAFARRVQLGLPVPELAGVFTPFAIAPTARLANLGAVKTPILRNVELTAPYMRNGGMLTLGQVVDFYTRGADFHEANIANLDPNIDTIPELVGNATGKAALIAFLRSLTDDRVRFEEAPFDHPQLFVPNGHPGDTAAVVDDGSGRALDTLLEIAAVGATGRCTGIDGVTRPCCGDGHLDANEQCDGAASDACPGACRSDCVCPGAAPPPVDLGAAADTYIEAGTESTWDHGASDHLDVDLSPFGITYLRFDLSGVTAPIRSAVLRVSCSNASDDGGTVYRVPDSSWVEGTQPGTSGASAAGPGLKWIQVDSNGDGAITAADASPFVPDLAHPIGSLGAVAAGQRVAVDVSAALSGAGVYTLALKSDSTNGATYSSRENGAAAARPQLHLEFFPVPATATATPVPTASATPTRTVTPTRTATPIPTVTGTRTATPTITTTATATAVPTTTATVTRTATPTGALTASVTPLPTGTATPTASVTATASVVVTSTVTPTISVTATATATTTATATATATPTVTATRTPTPTRTVTPLPTATPTATATPTVAVSATPIPASTATVTATPLATATRTSTPAATSTVSATVTPDATVTAPVTATPVPTVTGTVTATATPAPISLPDLVTARVATRCGRALTTMGAGFIAKALRSLDACATTMLGCIETSPTAATCLERARARCLTRLRAFDDAQAKLAARIVGACGRVPLQLGELMQANGLGYASLAARCAAAAGGEVTTVGGLAACIAGEHACAAERLADLHAPRTKELMRVAGIDAARRDALACLPDHGGDGAHLPSADPAARGVLGCQRALARASADLAAAGLDGGRACVGAAFKCVQLRPGDAACVGKARAACAARRAAGAAVVQAVAADLARVCAPATLPFAALRDADALALAALADECRRYGVDELSSLEAYRTCIVRHHACAAADLVGVQSPRSAELLALLGEAPAPGCPPAP